MTDEPRWRRYLRFRGPDIDADVDDELRFHLEMRERDFVEAGKSPEEARAAARARFGDVRGVRDWLRAHDRKRRGRRERTEIVDRLLRDVRYGARKLRQQPGFTLAAVAVLALGVGATTAIFSAVDAVLLRPLPFAEDGRLVHLRHVDIPSRFAGGPYPKAVPDLTDVAGMREVFSGVAAYAPGGLNLTGLASPLRVRIAVVTPSFFSTLGVAPAVGRPFSAEHGRAGAAPVAILSDALWRRQFGADRGVLERVIALNGKDYRVIGVMPRSFAFPEESELWLPMTLPMTFDDWEPFRQSMDSHLVARLAPGVSVEAAAARLRALAAQYASPDYLAEIEGDLVTPFRQVLVGDRATALLVLLGATALVLLVACANVASLLLSRASARRRELTLRAALGATPWRVAQQLLVESLLLAFIGGALGVGLAMRGLDLLRPLVPAELAGAVALRVDVRVLLFALAVVALTGIGFGMWPALGARRTNAGDAMRTGGTGTGGTGTVAGEDSPRLRRLLVVCELALALTLLVGAGVMLRSFHALLSTDSGVQPERVATLELSLAQASYRNTPERQRFIRGVLDRLAANPQVAAAAAVNELPLRGKGYVSLSVEAEGRPRDPRVNGIYAQDLRVTPGYFRALGIPLLGGRTLSLRDDSLAREVVVNEQLARTLWPGENPVGKRMIGPGGPEAYEVVGVVGNVLPHALDGEPAPQMYLSILRTPYPNFSIVARGRAGGASLTGPLREAVHAVAPDQATYNVRTMQEVISTTIAPRRTNTVLITLFGALALVLAAVGVYGVIAYGVARRTREIGIRIALGARPGQVVRQMLREGVALASIGVALGLMGAWMLTRALGGLVYGVSTRDPIAFAAAPVVLFAIALLASYLPARRAASVDPAQVLKAD